MLFFSFFVSQLRFCVLPQTLGEMNAKTLMCHINCFQILNKWLRLEVKDKQDPEKPGEDSYPFTQKKKKGSLSKY